MLAYRWIFQTMELKFLENWVACSSNPGVRRDFFPFFGPFLFHITVS